LTDIEKDLVYVTAEECFQIIGGDDEDQDFLERTPSSGRLNSDIDESFSMKAPRRSTLRKKSTMR